jgi:PP-loop superfamily ATP-utilizing enzyme
MDDVDYVANSPRRCYHCKSELYAKLRSLADQRGISWIVDGCNVDDLGTSARAKTQRVNRGRAVPWWKPASPRKTYAPYLTSEGCPPGTSRPWPAWPRASLTARRLPWKP